MDNGDQPKVFIGLIFGICGIAGIGGICGIAGIGGICGIGKIGEGESFEYSEKPTVLPCKSLITYPSIQPQCFPL